LIPTLTDDGSQIMTLFAQFGPADPAAWGEGGREPSRQRCLQQVARIAPNVPESVIDLEVLAPPDLEELFGLVGGSIFHGEPALDQLGFLRPAPLLSRYATPIEGLYLCGSGTHPGGGVTGAPGHNAAQRVLRDRLRGAWARRLRPAASR
jgi:phytoene dehydrogenase-like protein